MSHDRSRISRFVFAIVMLCAALAAHAEPLQFGARTLEIPRPQGFDALSIISPNQFKLAQAYLPATNRLVEAYILPEDAQAIVAIMAPSMARYFQLQVIRNLDGASISESQFQAGVKEMETEIEQGMKLTQELNAQIQKGNETAERMASKNPQVALSGTEYLGIYRREPWGLFFTIKVHASAAGRGDKTIVGSGAIMLANRQPLLVYGYSRFEAESDRQWTEQAVSAWADAIRGANPDGAVAATAPAAATTPVARVETAPAPAEANNTGGAASSALKGGAIGLIVVLIVGLIVRSQRKRGE